MLNVGDKVGDFGRIPPYGPPWGGVLLAVDDPRAWKGTIAFPCLNGEPLDIEMVRVHIAKCAERGDIITDVPVLWNFKSYSRVFWEKVDSLHPYADVLAEWHKDVDEKTT